MAKIYKSGKLTDHTLAKLERMCGAPCVDPALCWPKALLRNAQGEPVGYLMPRAGGYPLARSVFIRPLLSQHFPDWRRRDLVTTAMSVATAIGRLHAANMILGDINAENILVRADATISLVDLDSAQVEGYPCPVGTPDFTRAVHQGKPYTSYLRTAEDDRFALAVMLFKILLPGKHPFSHAGGEGPAANIRAGRFPYPLDGRGGQDVPNGPWRNIWGHLNKPTRTAFGECFADGALKTAEEWTAILRRYRESIERGYMDAEWGDALFPERARVFSEDQQRSLGITQKQRRDFRCATCARPFQETLDWLATHPDPTDCGDCRQAKRLHAQRTRPSRPAARQPVPRSGGRTAPARPPAPPLPHPVPRNASSGASKIGVAGLIAGLIALVLGG